MEDSVVGRIICLAYGECCTSNLLLVAPKICMHIETIAFCSAAHSGIYFFVKLLINWMNTCNTENCFDQYVFFAMIWIWLQLFKLWCTHIYMPLQNPRSRSSFHHPALGQCEAFMSQYMTSCATWAMHACMYLRRSEQRLGSRLNVNMMCMLLCIFVFGTGKIHCGTKIEECNGKIVKVYYWKVSVFLPRVAVLMPTNLPILSQLSNVEPKRFK